MGSGCSCTDTKKRRQSVIHPIQIHMNVYSRKSLELQKKDQSTNLKWNKLLETYSKYTEPITQFKKQEPTKFFKMLFKGPPKSLRWQVWKVALDVTENPQQYQALLSSNTLSENKSSISKDITRTFPELHYFSQEDGCSALSKVLEAYCNSESNVGYCQGMNYVAGFLLLIAEGEESEAFAVFHHLCLNGVSELFKQGFPLVFEMCRVFHESLSLSNQKLENYFQNNELDDNLWLIKWFLTLFVYSVKLEYATRIWDCVFARGLGFLVNVALGFVTNFKTQIKTKSPTEFLELINSFRSAEIDIEKVLAVADKTQLQQPDFLEAYVKENNTTENDKFNQH